MFVHSIASEEGGFTRVTIGGIEEMPGASPEWRRPVVLAEQAGRRLPAPQGFLSRVLSAPDVLILNVRTDTYREMGTAILSNAHDVVCATYGAQPLAFDIDGEPHVREPDGDIRSAGSPDVQMLSNW